MPENTRADWAHDGPSPKRPPGGVPSAPASAAPAPVTAATDSDGQALDTGHRVEEVLQQAQQQMTKLGRMNQALARSSQRAEQHLRRHEVALTLVHSYGSDLLFRLGKDGRFRFISDAGAAMLGMKPDELEGRPFTDLLRAAERVSIRGYLHEVLRAERVEMQRLKVRGIGEGFIELDFFFCTVPHPQTQAPEILGLGRPVNAAAAPAETPIGELGARLAHELSQPLTAIGATSRVCARRLRELIGADHEITQAIEQMADQTERAAEMIRRLRQLSTGSPPQRSAVDLNKLVEETMTSLAIPVRQANAPVALDLAANLPLVQADRIQLGQVLLNLIRNALEAMADVSSAQRQLTVRTRCAEGEAEVSVSDTGPGIPAATVDKLFQPYHTTKPHGMGLGLALCRSILQAHQGRLWVKPNSPHGVTFFFALPIHS